MLQSSLAAKGCTGYTVSHSHPLLGIEMHSCDDEVLRRYLDITLGDTRPSVHPDVDSNTSRELLLLCQRSREGGGALTATDVTIRLGQFAGQPKGSSSSGPCIREYQANPRVRVHLRFERVGDPSRTQVMAILWVIALRQCFRELMQPLGSRTQSA